MFFKGKISKISKYSIIFLMVAAVFFNFRVTTALAVTDAADEKAMWDAMVAADNAAVKMASDYSYIKSLGSSATDAQKQDALNRYNNFQSLYNTAQTSLNTANAIIATAGSDWSKTDEAKAQAADVKLSAASASSILTESTNYVVNGQTLGAASATGDQAAIDAALQEKLAYTNSQDGTGYCPVFQILAFAWSGGSIFNCVSQILYVILTIISWLLGLITSVFDFVFDKTVTNMKSFIDGVNVINIGWTAIRDMANILFIFMLLYLAIATILQLDEHGVKHGLSRLIVGAMLINFSLFFVKIPIDVSNILAIEIYNKINPTATNEIGGRLGMGDVIMDKLNFQSVFKSDINSTTLVWGTEFEKQAIAFARQTNPMSTFVMVIIMMATLAFVFLAVSVIFIKRLITLMMLMIFSPLAFAGMAIPNHSIESEITHKFWSQLLKESFYAPIFMFIMYLGLTIFGSTGFSQTVVTSDSSFLSGITDTVFSYVFVIIILLFALTVSEMMGVKGAAGGMAVFSRLKGVTTGAVGTVGSWAGRNTISKGAHMIMEKTDLGMEDIKQMGQGRLPGKLGDKGIGKFIQNSYLGSALIKGTGRTLRNTLDSVGVPYGEERKKMKEELADTVHELRDKPDEAARFVAERIKGKSGFNENMIAAKDMFHDMKDEEIANMVQSMEAQNFKVEAATLLGYQGKDRAVAIREMIDNKVTGYHKRKIGDATDHIKQRDQYENGKRDKDGKVIKGTKGTIDGAGKHGETLTGDDAKKHYAKLDSKTKLETDIADRYKNMNEDQQNKILSTLTQGQQQELAKNKTFLAALATGVENYQKLDATLKGGMAKELRVEINKIARQGSDRYKLYSAMQDPKNKTNPDLQKMWEELNGGQTFAQFEVNKTAKPDEYKKQLDFILENKTLFEADRNFKRTSAEDLESVERNKILDPYAASWKPKP